MLQSSKLSSRFKKKELRTEDEKVIKNEKQLESIQQPPVISSNTDDIYEIQTEIENALFEKINSIPVWFDYDVCRQKELIKSFITNKFSLSDEHISLLIDKLFKELVQFGPLNYLIEQNNVSSIYVNGNNSVHIEINGKILNTEIKLNPEKLKFVLSCISRMSGQSFHNLNGIINLKINNLQITIISADVSQSGLIIVIRKTDFVDAVTLIENSMMTKEIFDFIVSSVSAKKNIIISGAVNSGKTTLADALLAACINGRRAALIEKAPQINTCCDTLMKFLLSKNVSDNDLIISNILKMSPEYIIADLNETIPLFADRSGTIHTLRASSVDSAITKLVSAYAAYENLTEKYAKVRVLSEYDYIIQLAQDDNGFRYINSIVELSPARTAALSIKTIAKFVDNSYVTDFPQPLTSIRADSLISEAGSMSSRFLNQN